LCSDEIDRVVEAQQGSREAFGDLMRQHVGTVYSFASRFMPGRDDVDDVVQEVFLKAYQNLPRFDASQGKFSSWLLRITANTSIDLQKKRKTIRKYTDLQARSEPVFTEPRVLSEAFYHNSKELQSALQLLPDRERQAVLLFYYHDLTHREISDVLMIPLGTVKTRLRSAIGRLREELL